MTAGEHIRALDTGEQRRRAEGAAVAFAVGDALGWPQENRSRRAGAIAAQPSLAFAEWARREGGRYQAHEEVIPAGTYSDDTQLMLAMMRSLGAEDWWHRWVEVELPFWTLYERGGGIAIKRAAKSWASQQPPWERDAAAYFEAGANGVAMRVLPHCIVGASADSFESIARDVVADGITTHGHPRALIGALAFAYATWLALRVRDPLGYGELIQAVRNGLEYWTELPDLTAYSPKWREAAGRAVRRYDNLWRETVGEMERLLEISAEGIEQGALAVDRQTLESLGWFDPRMGGAGTITAAAAIFHASRHASRPTQGLITAAHLAGSDTDTLAAMVGSLLGAIDGAEWLAPVARSLQDHAYIQQLSAATAAGGVGVADRQPYRSIQRMWKQLVDSASGTHVELPDGRCGSVQTVADLPTKTRHRITAWTIRTDDGQTLRLKRSQRLSAEVAPAPTRPAVPSEAQTRTRPRIGVILEVRSLEESERFYSEVVGLEMTKQGPTTIGFAGLLAITASPEASPSPPPQLPLHGFDALDAPRQVIAVYVDRDELDRLHQRAVAAGVSISSVAGHPGRRGFRCTDPDGHVLQVREHNGHSGP